MKIKVAHVTSTVGGGAGIAALRIHLSMLNSEDVSSSFIQRYILNEAEYKDKNIYRCAPVHRFLYRMAIKLNLSGLFKPEKMAKAINAPVGKYETASNPITHYLLEEHPLIKEADIIHLHWIDFINFPTFFKKTKQPIVWTLHDMNPFSGMFHYEGDAEDNKHILADLDEKFIKIKEKSIHKHENIYVVSPSAWLKNKSEKSNALGRYPHYLIPYGIDVSLMPFLDKSESKTMLKINNNPTFLFISDNIYTKRKGLDLVHGAIKKINNIPFNLITLGSGNIDLSNENISHTHFDRTDDRELINRIYSAADFTIIASREDNLPNVMLESFFNGTPIISFANGGMAEHIQDNKNGLLADEINEESLADAMISVLNKEYIFDAKEIREYAIENFNIELQHERYISLYKSILSKTK